MGAMRNSAGHITRLQPFLHDSVSYDQFYMRSLCAIVSLCSPSSSSGTIGCMPSDIWMIGICADVMQYQTCGMMFTCFPVHGA